MYPHSTNSFQLTVRCLAGSSLAGLPVHHIDPLGCGRGVHAVGDMAGLAAAVSPGFGNRLFELAMAASTPLRRPPTDPGGSRTILKGASRLD